MGAVTTDVEVASSVPAQTIYKGFLLDMDNIIPKVLPQAIKSIEILSGDGGAGTIKKVTLGEGIFLFIKCYNNFIFRLNYSLRIRHAYITLRQTTVYI